MKAATESPIKGKASLLSSAEKRITMLKKLSVAAYTLVLATSHSHAIEIAPGDYSQFPEGANMTIIYYQHATTDSYYTRENNISPSFNVTSDISIFRMLHNIYLTDRLTVDPQFLLPFGRVSGKGGASGLGDTNGVGDLVVTAPLKYRLTDEGDLIAATTYIYIPTGSYDKNDPLNLGENRWKLDIQVGYINHINDTWAFDVSGDVIYYGDNDEYGPQSARLEQKISYEAQISARYKVDPSLEYALGFGHLWGGETQINGLDQNDKRSTSNVRLTTTKFVTPRDQFQMQLGKDLSVEQGVKEDFRMNLRYIRVF